MIVIILNDTKSSNHIQQLKLHLKDYEIIVLKDNYRNALKYAKSHHPNEPCLIIKDSSIIQYNLHHKINDILALNADMYFLCTWLDDCHKYTLTDCKDVKGTTSSFADQAIIYKPCARDHLIHYLKYDKLKYVLRNECHKLKKVACIPNIVHVDIDLMTSNKHLYKLNKVIIERPKRPKNNVNNTAWIILIIIFILLLVVLVPYLKAKRTI
jgi:hypothetical protein